MVYKFLNLYWDWIRPEVHVWTSGMASNITICLGNISQLVAYSVRNLVIITNIKLIKFDDVFKRTKF